jgi:hypothetical protein
MTPALLVAVFVALCSLVGHYFQYLQARRLKAALADARARLKTFGRTI